jgi:hypothetical protein
MNLNARAENRSELHRVLFLKGSLAKAAKVATERETLAVSKTDCRAGIRIHSGPFASFETFARVDPAPTPSVRDVFVSRAMVRDYVVTTGQLLPQCGNRLIDCPRAPIHDKAPYVQAQFIARDDAACVGAEVFEHLLFARLQDRGLFSFHEFVNVCMAVGART